VAIGANSYGSLTEVEAFVPQYTSSGLFDSTTRPSLAQVEKLIDRVSALLNTVLARQGFSIPITQADAKLVCDHFVVSEVADLCEAVNRAGRFTTKGLAGRNRFDVILEDCTGFVEAQATGLELLGATRDYSLTQGLGYQATDDAGEEIEPIFSRKWMRQDILDWDTE